MTTVAFKAGTMAADTQTNCGNARAGFVSKIFKVHGCLVGFSGVVPHQAGFVDWLEKGRIGPCPLFGRKEDERSSAMIAHPDGRLETFDTEGSCFIQPVCGVYAIGSGCDWAEGAMVAGASAEQAVQIAMLFDTRSGGDVEVIRLVDQQKMDDAEEEDDEITPTGPVDLSPLFARPPVEATGEDWKTRRGL